MKFSLKCALTISTLDGANIEIREQVGTENLFLFGLTAEQAQRTKTNGYPPRDYYERNAELRDVIDFIASGALAGGDKCLFRPLVDNLLFDDPFLLLADYQAYVACQEQVSAFWREPGAWTCKSILTAARMGQFASGRSVRDYWERVWKVKPVRVKME